MPRWKLPLCRDQSALPHPNKNGSAGNSGAVPCFQLSLSPAVAGGASAIFGAAATMSSR